MNIIIDNNPIIDAAEVHTNEIYGRVLFKIPKIGYLTLQHMEEKVQKQTDGEGGFKYYVVPERDKPVFTPDDEFIDDINMTGVTKSYRKRLKHDGLTLRDKERERRAKQILGLDIQEIGSEEAKAKYKASFDFDAKLQQLKNKHRDEYEDSDL